MCITIEIRFGDLDFSSGQPWRSKDHKHSHSSTIEFNMNGAIALWRQFKHIPMWFVLITPCLLVLTAPWVVSKSAQFDQSISHRTSVAATSACVNRLGLQLCVPVGC